MGRNIVFQLTHLDIVTILFKYCIFFKNKLSFRERVVLNMLKKLSGTWRGVGEMLTLADKERRGGLDPSFLADIICEQPLTYHSVKDGTELFTKLPILSVTFI